MKVEIDLPEIEGYEYTGEFRKPSGGDYFLTEGGHYCRYVSAVCGLVGLRPILRKKRWRAEKDDPYWFIGSDLVCDYSKETGDAWDNLRFKSGNYFQDRQQAEAMAEKVRALFKEGV